MFLVICAVLIKLRKATPYKTNYFKLHYGQFFGFFGIAISIWLLSASKLIEFRDVAFFIYWEVLFFMVFIKLFLIEKEDTSHLYKRKSTF